MKQENYWNMFTSLSLPDEQKTFTMLYKDTTFVGCKRFGEMVVGSSPCGEIHLHTTTRMIIDHNVENATRTNWRYE